MSLIKFALRILCLLLIFYSVKIPVKVNDEYIRTIWKSYANVRHALV